MNKCSREDIQYKRTNIDTKDIIFEIDEEVRRKLLERIPCGLMILDFKEDLLIPEYINEKYYELIGSTREKRTRFFGKHAIDAVHPNDRTELIRTVKEISDGADFCKVICRIKDDFGQYMWIQITAAAVQRSRECLKLYCSVTDVSRLIESQEEVKKIRNQLSSLKAQSEGVQAAYSNIKERRRLDRMTGLLNREPAEDKISVQLSHNAKGAFFFMDIDNFKLINDTYGHPEGDKVLKNFSSILKKIFDENCILARLGGDEFAAFMPGYHSLEKLRHYADTILSSSSAMVEDKILAEKIGISIGIAMAPEDGAEFSTLYANADKGLYFAKRNGKNRYSFYEKTAEAPDRENEGANLNSLRRMIQSVQYDRGAFLVRYDAFSKVFQFLERNRDRLNTNTQIVLFTMNDQNKELMDEKQFEAIRGDLEDAIRFSLRIGDVMMDFSKNQIAVLLVNCDTIDGINVAERVKAAFFKKNCHLANVMTYETGSINEVAK